MSFDRSQLGYQLGHCREAPGGPPDLWSAWKYGLRLGLYCSLCYAGFTLVLLMYGVMDLGLMALVAAALNAERFAPWPGRVARLSGLAMLGIGVLAMVQGGMFIRLFTRITGNTDPTIIPLSDKRHMTS
jgi:hypothetical protein